MMPKRNIISSHDAVPDDLYSTYVPPPPLDPSDPYDAHFIELQKMEATYNAWKEEVRLTERSFLQEIRRLDSECFALFREKRARTEQEEIAASPPVEIAACPPVEIAACPPV